MPSTRFVVLCLCGHCHFLVLVVRHQRFVPVSEEKEEEDGLQLEEFRKRKTRSHRWQKGKRKKEDNKKKSKTNVCLACLWRGLRRE